MLDVGGLVPARHSERFVQFFPVAKSGVVVRQRTLGLPSPDVVFVDRPCNELGLAGKPTLPARVTEPLATELPIWRCPGVCQFESKRSSSITAVLARVTARAFSSGVTLWVRPASVYTTTLPQWSAHPEKYDDDGEVGEEFE